MKPRDIESDIELIRLKGLRVWLLEALTKAFEDARRGKLKTYDEHAFEANWIENLTKLRDAILEWRYTPGASVTFVIFEPMVREIFAAPFRDRVVHHFLYNMQAGWWDARFIYDSYSCRVGKGTLFGIKRIQRYMRVASENYTKKAYIVKADLQGYFMSLPRQGLYDEVKLGLDKQFAKYIDDPMGYQVYKICDFLWKQVLFDDPVVKARRRGSKNNWNPDILPPRKSLFRQPPGKGIVIGNLTSQLASNIYLNQLDRYVKYELGYKNYGRYVDDFIVIVPEEQYVALKQDMKKIEHFLSEKLTLTMHPDKRYCQEVKKGVSFLGARIYPNCLYPSDRLQSSFQRAASGLAQGYSNVDSLISYLGIMKHFDGNKFVREIFDEMGFALDDLME